MDELEDSGVTSLSIAGRMELYREAVVSTKTNSSVSCILSAHVSVVCVLCLSGLVWSGLALVSLYGFC